MVESNNAAGKSVLARFLRVCFMVTFGLVSSIAAVACMGLLELPEALLSTRRRKSAAALVVQFFWRLGMLCSPWICIHKLDGVGNRVLEVQDETRPTIVLVNHTSFLDTLIAVTLLPYGTVHRARTYLASYLLKIPLLSSMIRAIGHYPVHFKRSEDGDFSVDKERMREVTRDVQKHLDMNGVLIFFPEGQINDNPDRLLDFRFGGMQTILDADARVVQLVTYGCHQCWPRRMQVGGYPCSVAYGLEEVAPTGARALIKRLRADSKDPGLSDAAILASYARGMMQAQYDRLGEKLREQNL